MNFMNLSSVIAENTEVKSFFFVFFFGFALPYYLLSAETNRQPGCKTIGSVLSLRAFGDISNVKLEM